MWVYDKKDEVKNKLKNYLDMDKFPEIKGYNFDNEFNFNEFIKSYKNMAFQGSNLGLAIEILDHIYKKRINDKIKIYLSFTGNMISSGNREIIKFLVKNSLIDAIVTTAAGVEEDIIKTIKPFHLGTFDVKGEVLLNECIGRIGNIFVPADRYLYLERFINTIFPKIKNSAPYEICHLIGKEIKDNELTKEKYEDSFLYWAYRNDIPVFCPGITDGAIGDMTVFYKQKDKNLSIDITKENEYLTKLLMNSEKTAGIILGGGISKHFLLNSAIFRDGLDYSIYITTSQAFDGSDSGGNQEEAITWAKIKPKSERVIVNCEATIAFPLLIASVFKNEKNN
jgi:deoxyhypusine synthase